MATQLDDPAAGPVPGRCDPGWWSGFAGRGGQVQGAGPVLADQVDHSPPGVAEPLRGLGVGQPVDEERAQRLVPAVVGLLRGGEPVRARDLF